MVARRVLRNVNDSASLILVRTFVVLAARILGPGPTRLRLVRLAHNLGPSPLVMKPGKDGNDAGQEAAA